MATPSSVNQSEKITRLRRYKPLTPTPVGTLSSSDTSLLGRLKRGQSTVSSLLRFPALKSNEKGTVHHNNRLVNLSKSEKHQSVYSKGSSHSRRKAVFGTPGRAPLSVHSQTGNSEKFFANNFEEHFDPLELFESDFITPFGQKSFLKQSDSVLSYQSTSSDSTVNSNFTKSSLTSFKSAQSFKRLSRTFESLDNSLKSLIPTCQDILCDKTESSESVCSSCQLSFDRENEVIFSVATAVAFDIEKLIVSSQVNKLDQKFTTQDIISTSTAFKSKMRKIDFSVFDRESCCPLTIFDFLLRLVKYMQIWFDRTTKKREIKNHSGLRSLFISLVYLCKLQEATKVEFTKTNIHNILLGTFLLAAKYTEDEAINLKWWKTVGEVSLQQLNEIEVEICKALNFELFIKDELIANMFKRYIPENVE